jgi:hypothetical protein
MSSKNSQRMGDGVKGEQIAGRGSPTSTPVFSLPFGKIFVSKS